MWLLLSPYAGHSQVLPVNTANSVIDVMNYGAKCDGVTNDSTAVNNAIAAIRARSVTADFRNGPPGHLVFPATATGCKITSTINATSGSSGGTLYGAGFVFDMTGAMLICSTSGTPCIDATGTGQATWLNLNIYGTSTNAPNIGLALGRVTNNFVGADDNKIYNPTIVGTFTLAPYFNNQSETTIISGANFYNYAANAYGAIWDGSNHFHFQTLAVGGPYPQNVYESFNENVCILCNIGVSGIGAVSIWIGGTSRHRFINLYNSNNPSAPTTPSPSIVLWYGNSLTNDLLELDAHTENVGGVAAAMPNVVMFSGAAAIAQNSLEIRDGFSEQSGAYFARDTTARFGTTPTSIIIRHADFNIMHQANGGSGATWFDTPADYVIDGNIYAGDNTYNSPGTFTGNLINNGAASSYISTLVPVQSGNAITIQPPGASSGNLQVNLGAPYGSTGAVSTTYFNGADVANWQLGANTGTAPPFFLYDVANGANAIVVNANKGTLQLAADGRVSSFGGVTTLAVYTVATLPACSGANGNGLAIVSDATSPTYNAALTGGGTVRVPVFCNGTSWSAH
jgi:hypothetical protein